MMISIRQQSLLICTFSLLLMGSTTVAFQSSLSGYHQALSNQVSWSSRAPTTNTASFLSKRNKEGGGDEFSQEVRLRTEAESPFVKVRYFFYITAAGGALTSLAISVARIAAGWSGINTDLLPQSLENAAIDLAGLIVVGFLYQGDLVAEESRLKRASRGAEIAKLNVRISKRLLGDVEDGMFTTSLASLRRGRGIEKRVIIAAAGKEKIIQVLREASELQDELSFNDLIVVPVVMPRGVAPETEVTDLAEKCVALPVTVGSSWKNYVEEEASEAIKQGVNVEDDGICIVLKKNGRVGQRTKGIYLRNLVGNVVARREAGMDISNI